MLSPGYNWSHQDKGTLSYISPEVLTGQPFNEKADIWALGCILYEMIAGKRAFDCDNEMVLKQRIQQY